VQETGICLEYEMVDVDIDPHAAEMYFSARFAPGGYAWIIPLGRDCANVGLASGPPTSQGSGCLRSWIVSSPSIPLPGKSWLGAKQ